eukprot:5017923-Pyramimonas_sp.AAC.1
MISCNLCGAIWVVESMWCSLDGTRQCTAMHYSATHINCAVMQVNPNQCAGKLCEATQRNAKQRKAIATQSKAT